MKITALIAKNSRVQIYIDERYIFSSSINFIINKSLHIGQELDNTELETLKKEAILSIAKVKLEEYASRAILSKKELFIRLNRYLNKRYNLVLDPKQFEDYFGNIIKIGLYSERSLITSHIRLLISRKKGKRFIQSKLISKGFEKELIAQELAHQEENEGENYREQLKIFLENKYRLLKPKSKNKYELNNKLIKSAMGRGYELNIIKEVLGEII